MSRRHRVTDAYDPAPFFVLRTPLLSEAVFEAWSAGLAAPDAAAAGLDAAVERDRGLLRERLRALLERAEIREAILIASPSLHASIAAWRRDPDSPHGRRAERGLVRYVTRMATRPTPFGLFAGCTTGDVGPSTRLDLVGPFVRSTRLDMGYLDLLTRTLTGDRTSTRAPRLRPNPTWYRSGPSVRYIETRSEGYGRSHHLVAVRATAAVDAALEAASDGVAPGTIERALRATAGDAAPSLLAKLVDAQLLVPDPLPALTGPPPLAAAIEALEAWPDTAPAVAVLRRVAERLAEQDAAGPGADPEGYERIADELRSLAAPVDPSLLFQVDLLRGADGATLGPAVVTELARATDLLRILAPGGEPAELAEWRQRFERRFELREVPLLQALDEESGVPFGAGAGDASPLLRDLPFAETEPEVVAWRAADRLLLGRVSEALDTGAEEVVLTPRDLEALDEVEPAPLPTSFAVIAVVAAASADDLDRGRFEVRVRAVHGPPATRSLGRWCHADPRLAGLVGEHARAEEAIEPDAIFAEIVHVPAGREGNVLARPVLRGYEIPVLAASGAPPDRRIPLQDLRIRSEAGRLILRSARLGRRVVPRLTTAHNLGRAGVGVYRFLCLLASQGTTDALVWLPEILQHVRRLPRIRAGRVVLTPARWRIDPAEAQAFRSASGPELLRVLRGWRERARAPRTVRLVDGDRVLRADLENVLSAESFAAALPATGAVVEEVFPASDRLPVRGPDGPLAAEIVLPFVARRRGSSSSEPARSVTRVPNDAEVRRSFPPGSEWLTLKVYAGTATVDRVLDVLARRAEALTDEGRVQRWFFLRYGDPEWHLRLRLQGEPSVLAEALQQMRDDLEPELEDGSIARVETATYHREVERYGGGEGVELAETLFHADSVAVARILRMLERGDAGAVERWRLALAGAHRWFAALLGQDEEAVVARIAESHAREHRVDAELGAAIGDRYRRERAGLQALLEPDPQPDHPLAPGLELLRDATRRAEPAVRRVRELAERRDLGVPLASFAASVVHLHVNRFARSAPRRTELVLTTFLARSLRERRERNAARR